MADPVVNAISLCSGVGMLDAGFEAGLGHLGIRMRTLLYAEREAYPASVLVARMEEGSLHPAPVWFGDFTKLPASKFRGLVDCVVAGFPCQDLSVAGRRAGLDGARSGLFFHILDVADACGAQLLFLENVAGIASATASVVDEAEGALEERAASRVLGELADRGWYAEWITVSASDVGASHGRERWFCFAWRPMVDAECPERWAVGSPGSGGQQGHDGGRAEADRGAGESVEVLGDTECTRRPPPGCGHEQHTGREPEPGCGELADTEQPGPQGQRPAIAQRWCEPEPCGRAGRLLPFFAPGPADGRWADVLAEHPYLAPALEPSFRGMVDGVAFAMDESRAPRLKCVGNGVVALQAGLAFVVLARRAWGVMA